MYCLLMTCCYRCISLCYIGLSAYTWVIAARMRRCICLYHMRLSAYTRVSGVLTCHCIMLRVL